MQKTVIGKINEKYKKEKIGFDHFYDNLNTSFLQPDKEEHSSDNIVQEIMLEITHFFTNTEQD